MCNPKLIAVAAIGGALFTGGASLGLLGGLGVGTAATTAGVAGATATAAATSSLTGLTAMQGISMAASLAGTGMSIAGQAQQAAIQSKIAANNAKVSEYQAQSALAAGERDAQAVARKGSQLEGAQRARMAASGLDISDGTPAALLDQTNFFTQQDVATTRDNAKKAAWAAQAQASGYQAQAGYSPLLASSGSMLTGAGQVADKWYTYTKGV